MVGQKSEWTLGWQAGYGQQSSPKFHVVAYDFGVKKNILRMLAERGCKVTVVPAQTPAAEVLKYQPDGIFLSNGPGDPEPCDYAIAAAKELIETGTPTFGICLGHQIMALASGAKTFKMKFGHHGANHPVKDLDSGRVSITSQNHGFAVDEKTLPANLRPTHVSLFDSTLQGLERTDRPAFCFQGHPEASPGPHDIGYLFDRFIGLMERPTPSANERLRRDRYLDLRGWCGWHYFAARTELSVRAVGCDRTRRARRLPRGMRRICGRHHFAGAHSVGGCQPAAHTPGALFMVVKYAGAAYLTWVGVNLVRGAVAKWRSGSEVRVDSEAAVADMVANMQQPFKRALVISLLNPKAILFLLSFFVQFIDPTYATPAVPFLILGGIIMAFSAAYLSALIFAGARLAQGFRRRKRLSASLVQCGGRPVCLVWCQAGNRQSELTRSEFITKVKSKAQVLPCQNVPT